MAEFNMNEQGRFNLDEQGRPQVDVYGAVPAEELTPTPEPGAAPSTEGLETVTEVHDGGPAPVPTGETELPVAAPEGTPLALDGGPAPTE